tara:strand:- start:142 stop:1341 length:1200 start_codon:yes stop_codon:yes gene_type:complete
MYSYLNNYNKILITFFLFFLIFGPAIPDIIATLFSILCLYFIFKDKIFNENFFILILSFILLLIPNFFSLYPSHSITEFIVNIRYFLFAYFISKYLKVDFEFIIKVLLIITLMLSFDLVFQYIFTFNLLGFPLDQSHNGSRASSFFRDELVAGSYIFKFGLPVIGYFLYKKKFILSFLITLFFEIAIICTGERMSFLLFSLGILILILFVLKDIKKILIVIFSGIIIFLSLYNISDRVKFRVNTFTSLFLTDSTENFRNDGHVAHIWTAYEIFKKNPYFGTGHKTFRFECSNEDIQFLVKSNSNGCSTHPHNSYFEILSDFGLFGFLSFLFFVLILLKKYKRNILYNSKLCGFYASFITIIWPISTSGNFFNNRIALMNFFIIGVLLCYSKKNILKKFF